MGHDLTRQHRAASPRPTLADQLESITADFDALTQRARLGGHSARDFDEMEEGAQAIAAALVAVFRGTRTNPTNPPLYVSRDGTKAAW
ncbi:hypothetical protein [Sphingomonas sp. VNH70]|uniref:hypothetical protein n=1 Tax=Sphingomonas silueang TaxID=3156617 RepID=UPI0032B3E313